MLHTIGRQAPSGPFNVTFAQEPYRDVECNKRLRSASGHLNDANVTAFDHIGGSHMEVWATAVGCLKPGDVLTLEFVADGLGGGQGDNGYLSLASIQESDSRSHATAAGGLHGDVVYLHVQRLSERDKLMGRNGHSFTFMLSASVCPNNTARMLRGL